MADVAPPGPCELCRDDGGEVLWRDDLARVVRVDEPLHPGFLRVILNRHVAEMSDLAPPDQLTLMRIVMAAEAALRAELAPDKVNLASLGNLTPHVHWHVIARFRDDPHFPQAIWGPLQRPAPPRALPVGWAERVGTALARNLAGR